MRNIRNIRKHGWVTPPYEQLQKMSRHALIMLAGDINLSRTAIRDIAAILLERQQRNDPF